MKQSYASIVEIKNLNLDYEVRRIQENRALWKNLFHSVYEKNSVLRNLSWSIPEKPGITALLGRNGSGKTTLLKVMTGILRPSSGEVSVLGYEPKKRSASFLKSIGVVFGQKRILWPELSVLENLRITGALYALSTDVTNERIASLSRAFDLQKLLERPQKSLSLGESMKAELLNALLPKPKVLFLDEPTVGLDIQSQISIRRMLKDCVERDNCHIVLTSHNLRDIAELASRIFVLEHGQLNEFISNMRSQDLALALESRLTMDAS